MSTRRDPRRSRQQILDGAEEVFARDGFDGASLAEIGRVAQVSAALPAYFFGDKQALYDAVIARLFESRDAVLVPVCETATATLDEGPGRTRAALEVLVRGYLGFLKDRPAFVRLMTREALETSRRATAPRHPSALQQGIAEFIGRLPTADEPALDADQLLITLIALCWFPLEHDATMLAGMGYAAWEDAFLDARAAHVVDVLDRVLRAGRLPDPPPRQVS